MKKLFFIPMLIIFFGLLGQELSAQTVKPLNSRLDYILEAKDRFEKNDIEGAKIIIDQGLSKYPKNSDLKRLLGKYYFEIKEYDLARYELVKALEYNGDNVDAKQLLVNVEAETQRYSSAICYLNELLEVTPYWKGLWMKKIEIYRLQGNQVEANRLLKRIYQIYPNDKDLQEAYIYYTSNEAINKKKQGKISEATKLMLELIENSPNDEAAFIDLINCYISVGEYENALIYADRGIVNIPNSLALIRKRNSILSHLKRYEEILSFLTKKIKQGGNKMALTREYDYYMEEAANHHRQSDPYHLTKILLKQKPHEEKYLNYVYGSAIEKNLYEDAMEAIDIFMQNNKETKELLAKKLYLYEKMGEQTKADALLEYMFKKYPDDSFILEKQIAYRLRRAKTAMNQGFYARALPHWSFVEEYADDDLKLIALNAIFNCRNNLGDQENARKTIDKLKKLNPNNPEYFAKNAILYGDNKQFFEALSEYEAGLTFVHPLNIDKYLNGYDELAIKYTKELIENHQLDDAIKLIDQWLTTHPQSEFAPRYAINTAFQLKDYDNVKKYITIGLENSPNEPFYLKKLIELKKIEGEYAEALSDLDSLILKHPYHTGVINVYTETSLNYAKQLTKELKSNECLEVVDKALLYDPSNNTLKYYKGIAFERLKDIDSAYYYQSFYEPSRKEQKDYDMHMKFLGYESKKNQMSFSWQRFRTNEDDLIFSIASAEYSRKERKNNYIGRVNYSARDEGLGLQGQIEWSHLWTKSLYSKVNFAMGERYFPKYVANLSFYKGFGKDYELELGGGYRRLVTSDNMINTTVGLSKEFYPCKLTLNLKNVLIREKIHYNISLKSHFFIRDQRSYIMAMAGFGSAPDLELIDNIYYNSFSARNSMVGLGTQYLISNSVAVVVLGTWHSYKLENSKDKPFINIYDLLIQLNVKF